MVPALSKEYGQQRAARLTRLTIRKNQRTPKVLNPQTGEESKTAILASFRASVLIRNAREWRQGPGTENCLHLHEVHTYLYIHSQLGRKAQGKRKRFLCIGELRFSLEVPKNASPLRRSTQDR